MAAHCAGRTPEKRAHHRRGGPAQWAPRDNKIALTVVGPEAPWPPAWWMSSVHGLRIFGPTRLRRPSLEAPKGFSKAFMRAMAFPLPRSETFTDPAAAHAFYVDKLGAPIVIKTDGLAAGKGVVGGHDAGRSPRGAWTSCCWTTSWA